MNLTKKELELLAVLLRIDPGPLGLSAAQARTAQGLLTKVRASLAQSADSV